MSDKSIGIMMSAFFIGYVICSIVVPRVVETVGHIRTFAALASIASAAALGHILYISPVSWTLFRVINGGCYAGLILIAESWLNSFTDCAHRGRVLAIYGMVLLGSFAGGQSLLNLAPPSRFSLFCLVSILLSLALVPITLTRATIPGSVSASRLGLRRLYEISPLSIAGVFVVGLWMSAFVGMGPVFAKQFSLGNAEISLFMGISMVGTLVFQWPLGWLSDKIDRRWMIIWLTIGTGMVSILTALLTKNHSFPALIALSFIFGGLSIPVYSVCVAHTNDLIGKEEMVGAASSLILIYGVGSAASPFLASVTMSRLGHEGLFIYLSFCSGVFLIFNIYRLIRGKAILREFKGKFLVIPRTTHVALQMHKHAKQQEKEAAPD
jgi:MFS family permease